MPSFELFLELLRASTYEHYLRSKLVDFSAAERLLWIAEFFKMADLQKVLVESCLRPQLSTEAAFELIAKTHLKLKNSPQIEPLWLDLLQSLVDHLALHIQEVQRDFLKNFRGLPNSLINEEILERAVKLALHSEGCHDEQAKNADLLAACELYLQLRRSDAVGQLHREIQNLEHSNLLQQGHKWTPMCVKKEGFEKIHSLEQNALSWKLKVRYDHLQNQFLLRLVVAPLFASSSEQRLLKCFPQLSPTHSQLLIPVVKEDRDASLLDIRESCQLPVPGDEDRFPQRSASAKATGLSPRLRKQRKVKEFYAAVYGAPVHKKRRPSEPGRQRQSQSNRRGSISSQKSIRPLTPQLFSRASTAMSPARPEKHAAKNRRYLSRDEEAEEASATADRSRPEALRTKLALLVNVQVSIQGGSLITRTLPFVYPGAPLEFPLAKFQTLESLERVSLRFNFHLHYFGSGLLNQIAASLLDPPEHFRLERLSFSEMKTALGSQLFQGESKQEALVSALLRWIGVAQNLTTVTSQRRREFEGLLSKVRWQKVSNVTLLEVMRHSGLLPMVNRNPELLQVIKQELSRRAEASCLAQQQRCSQKVLPNPNPNAKQEDLKSEQTQLGDDEKDLGASCYEEAPSNMRSADASRIMDEPGLDSSAGQDLSLAEILAQSREQLQQEYPGGVGGDKSSCEVTVSSRQMFGSSKSEFLEPPCDRSDLIRKRSTSGGRATAAFLQRQRSTGSRISSQFSPTHNNSSFFMDELKKRDEEIALLKQELVEVRKIQIEQLRPHSSAGGQVEANVISCADLDQLARMSAGHDHSLGGGGVNPLNFVTFDVHTRESEISRVASSAQLTTDGLSTHECPPPRPVSQFSIFTNANRRSNRSLLSAQTAQPDMRSVSPFQPFTQSSFGERMPGKTPTRVIKIDELRQTLPPQYETPVRAPLNSQVNTTFRPPVQYLPNRSASVRSKQSGREPLLVNSIRETSPHQLISSIQGTRSARLQLSNSEQAVSPHGGGHYLKRRYMDFVNSSAFTEQSESPALQMPPPRTETPQFQYQSFRSKH